MRLFKNAFHELLFPPGDVQGRRRLRVRRRQRRNEDRVAHRQVARLCDQVADGWFHLLDRTALAVLVAEKNQFELLGCPHAADALAVDLDSLVWVGVQQMSE